MILKKRIKKEVDLQSRLRRDFLLYTLGMILKLFELRKQYREARRDPSGFASGQFMGILKGVLVVWKIILLLPLLVFGVFSFTTIFGGPYEWMRWVFFLWLIGWIVMMLILRIIVKVIERNVKKVSDATMSKIRDVPFTHHEK